MTKRNVIATILIVIVLLIVCGIAVACPEKEKAQKTYDLSMKVVRRRLVNGKEGPILEVWTFTPDVDVLYTEREYDGNQYVYRLEKIENPKYIKPSAQWLEVGSVDEVHSSLWKEGEPKENIYEYVCEKGDYVLLARIYDSGCHSFSWNVRTLRLCIKIK